MQRAAWRVLFVGLLLNAAAMAQSQSGDSLADIARANRAKQQEQEAAGAKPKIITNQDLPSAPSGIPESVEPMTTVSGVKRSVDSFSEQRANQQLVAEYRAGEQWKARIQDQEARIADLQTRIDRVNQSMRAAVGTAQYDTPLSVDSDGTPGAHAGDARPATAKTFDDARRSPAHRYGTVANLATPGKTEDR
jgi:hypothetical protein